MPIEKDSNNKKKSNNNNENSHGIFIPNDIRMPRMLIPFKQLPAEFHKRPQDFAKYIYIAELLDDWPADSNFAKGRLIKEVGCIGDINAETESLLMEKNIDTSEFSDAVYDSLKEFLSEEKIPILKSNKSPKKIVEFDANNKSENEINTLINKNWKIKNVFF